MTFVSAGYIILTPTQSGGSGRPQRGSNPGPPHQELRALPTELPISWKGVPINGMDLIILILSLASQWPGRLHHSENKSSCSPYLYAVTVSLIHRYQRENEIYLTKLSD